MSRIYVGPEYEGTEGGYVHCDLGTLREIDAAAAKAKGTREAAAVKLLGLSKQKKGGKA